MALDPVREDYTFACFLPVEHMVDAYGLIVNTDGIVGKDSLLCHIPSRPPFRGLLMGCAVPVA